MLRMSQPQNTGARRRPGRYTGWLPRRPAAPRKAVTTAAPQAEAPMTSSPSKNTHPVALILGIDQNCLSISIGAHPNRPFGGREIRLEERMIEIATSEFLWGIILGLIVSIVGARFQAKEIRRHHIAQATSDVNIFCAHIIENIQIVIADLGEARRRSRVIHGDILALLDSEIHIFGRNRENIIRLDGKLRNDVRKFIVDCGLRRSAVVGQLGLFDNKMGLARQLRANGDGPQATRVEQEAMAFLEEAHRATDELIAVVEQRAPTLVTRLQSA